VAQIMDAHIRQSTFAPELRPPRIKLLRRNASSVREHERTAVNWSLRIEDGERLTIEPDQLGPRFAIGQHQSGRFYPLPMQIADFTHARASEH
jgi:hypothetical protein